MLPEVNTSITAGGVISLELILLLVVARNFSVVSVAVVSVGSDSSVVTTSQLGPEKSSVHSDVKDKSILAIPNIPE